ncbi:MAG: hypothetical protein AAB656_04685 [Patescibacteria group bacterium]
MGRQSYQRTTKQVRIDSGLHKQLKVRAAMAEMTLREFIEGSLLELIDVKND